MARAGSFVVPRTAGRLLQPRLDEGVDRLALEHQTEAEDRQADQAREGHQCTPVIALGAEEAAKAEWDHRVGALQETMADQK